MRRGLQPDVFFGLEVDGPVSGSLRFCLKRSLGPSVLANEQKIV